MCRSKKKVKTIVAQKKKRKIVNFGEKKKGVTRNRGFVVQVIIRKYPSVQSEQRFRNARGAIPIRDESPPIGLHLSPVRTVTFP